MEKLLELRELCAAYDQELVLKDVNLSIWKNDFLGIIGPNGGGKTTLLKLMLGLLKPSSGKLIKCRKSLKTGYLPQINPIDKKFPITVNEVVLSGLMSTKKLLQRYNASDKEKAESLLQEMNMHSFKHKNIGELSGGQLQRVLLCRAIISNPDLLILDEPDTYVDTNFEGELYEKLHQLNNRMAIVVVSHDVGTICSHVKTIACVNKTLCYHDSNIISQEQLKAYNCPIDLITHGEVPHRVLKHHH